METPHDDPDGKIPSSPHSNRNFAKRNDAIRIHTACCLPDRDRYAIAGSLDFNPLMIIFKMRKW
jgi:hypothetical protein